MGDDSGRKWREKGGRTILVQKEETDTRLFFSLGWGVSLKGGEYSRACAWEKKLQRDIQGDILRSFVSVYWQ